MHARTRRYSYDTFKTKNARTHARTRRYSYDTFIRSDKKKTSGYDSFGRRQLHLSELALKLAYQVFIKSKGHTLRKSRIKLISEGLVLTR